MVGVVLAGEGFDADLLEVVEGGEALAGGVLVAGVAEGGEDVSVLGTDVKLGWEMFAMFLDDGVECDDGVETHIVNWPSSSREVQCLRHCSADATRKITLRKLSNQQSFLSGFVS